MLFVIPQVIFKSYFDSKVWHDVVSTDQLTDIKGGRNIARVSSESIFSKSHKSGKHTHRTAYVLFVSFCVACNVNAKRLLHTLLQKQHRIKLRVFRKMYVRNIRTP